MDPITWFALISAVVGLLAANDAADKQSNAVTRASQVRENDRKRQQDEAFRQGTAQVNEEARQAMADMALFDTVAGEYGGGRSIDRARAVAGVQNTERLTTIQSNSRLGLQQLGFDGLANQSRADSQEAAINRPSLLGSALAIGSGYMQDTRYQRQTQRPNTNG